MKITKLILPILLLLLLAGTAFADEQSHRQLAEEFVVLTEIEQLMTKSFSKARTEQMRRIEVDYLDADPGDVATLQEKVGDYLDTQLRFERVKEDFIKVYMDFFTEEELRAIVDFYRSPAIKKLKENDRNLKLKLMKATQDQMQDLNYRIKKIKEDFDARKEKKETLPAGSEEEETQKDSE